MDKRFICDRITELRMRDGLSEYQLSLNLGKSKSYIQCISSGKALPSLQGLLEICDYFNITPYEFFSIDQYSDSFMENLRANVDSLDIENLSKTVKFLESLKDYTKNNPPNKT